MPGEVVRLARPSAARLLRPAAAFARYGAQLERLRRGSDELTAMTFAPAWWEAVPAPPGYLHRLLVLEREGEVVAALRFRERTFWRLPTGILHGGDAKGESLVLCLPGAEQQCLAEGMRALFRSRRCLALLLHRPRTDADEVYPFTASLHGTKLEMRTQPAVSFWRTVLKPTMQGTLAAFGHRTRRNLRHALRRAAQNGWTFVPDLTPQQVSEATKALGSNSTHPYTARASEARLELERAHRDGFSMGLLDRDGVWLSVVSGVRRPDGTADVFWQSNLAYLRDSVSFAMRAEMMRYEGERETKVLRWIGGTSPLMEHCCQAEPGSETLMTRPGLRLALLRRLLQTRLATEANPMKRLLRLEPVGIR